jgi:ribose-phosphate pyrophosphokinase
MIVKNEVKIFSGTNSRYLAEQVAKAYGLNLGDCVISRFSDGEFQPSFNESVRGSDVFLIQSTFANSDNLMELLLMIDAAKRASAHYITAVIPYYGMARQDRKDKPRVSIGSKVIADMLTVVGASRVITMDLHAPQIQGFFEIPVDHLDPSIIFLAYSDPTGGARDPYDASIVFLLYSDSTCTTSSQNGLSTLLSYGCASIGGCGSYIIGISFIVTSLL